MGILDTGIDATHEAFQGIELVQRDFTGEGDRDQDGHGTHVAGTLFGQTVRGVRYAIAPGIRRAIIAKVIGTRHAATTKDISDAIQWAVDQGAQLINLSLGFDFPGLVKWWTEARGIPVDLATSRALAECRDNVRLFDRLVGLLQAQARQANSALLIAAAGNESKRDQGPDYVIEVAPPAAAEDIVAVGALESTGAPYQNLQVARFSNIRPLVAAPGVGIYSAKAGGGYTVLDGTSMASPHATGIAALWAQRQIDRTGQIDPKGIAALLRANARRDPLPDAAFLDVGEGLVTAPRD